MCSQEVPCVCARTNPGVHVVSCLSFTGHASYCGLTAELIIQTQRWTLVGRLTGNTLVWHGRTDWRGTALLVVAAVVILWLVGLSHTSDLPA